MRGVLIGAVVIAGCGGNAPPERLPQVPKREAPPVVDEPEPVLTALPHSSDDDLRALWQELRVDGDNWMDQVATIPESLRTPMASVLLRGGNFSCRTVELRDGCKSDVTLGGPTGSSDLHDPCLRRMLALWAIDQIRDEDTAYLLYDTLIALVQIPPPERELGEAAISKIPRGGWMALNAIWEASWAGNQELADAHVDMLDPADLVSAAQKHIDGAVLALIDEPSVPVTAYSSSAYDGALQPATRIALIRHLADRAAEAGEKSAEWWDFVESLRYARDWRDCSIRSAAAGALLDLGLAAELPSGPYKTEEDLILATCTTLGVVGPRGPEWKTILTPHVLVATNHLDDPLHVDALWTKYPYAIDADLDGAPDVPEADLDRDGRPSTYTKVKRVRFGRWTEVPFADELQLALPHCDGADCKVPGTSVWFHLDIGKERGTKLRLRAIDRYERVGFDC